jgi:hypothetical protein
MSAPVNLFLDLIELEDVTTKGIFSLLLQHLQTFGMTEDYLSEHLVSVVCDGAAVMLGNPSGVKKLMKEIFSSVTVWHGVKQRLELSVSDSVHAVLGMNRFKSFSDKLYVLYHASPKNSRELHACSKLLGLKLLTIGRIFSTR